MGLASLAQLSFTAIVQAIPESGHTLVVSGAVSDNVVVCIFCNNVIYVWRVWWELMGKDLGNIIRYIYLSRVYLSYLANFRVWPGNDPRATSRCKMVADHT